MHSILLASKWPNSTGVIDIEKLKIWNGCADRINTIARRNQEIQLIGQGVWLIRGENALSFLAEAVTVLKEYRVAYLTIVIDQVSDWPIVMPDEAKISWIEPK